MLDERGLAVFLMLISIAASYLTGGVLPGIICLALAAMIALVLWTPLRGWLGIPPAKKGSVVDRPAEHVGYRDSPGSTVVRVRDSKDVINIENVGYGTDSVIDAKAVEGLINIDNQLLRPPKTPKNGPDGPRPPSAR
jgi:hypothetical protein